MKEFTITWTSQDVIDRAKENGVLISEDEADIVIWFLEERYDCNTGITWDDLDYYIAQVTEGRLP